MLHDIRSPSWGYVTGDAGSPAVEREDAKAAKAWFGKLFFAPFAASRWIPKERPAKHLPGRWIARLVVCRRAASVRVAMIDVFELLVVVRAALFEHQLTATQDRHVIGAIGDRLEIVGDDHDDRAGVP